MEQHFRIQDTPEARRVLDSADLPYVQQDEYLCLQYDDASYLTMVDN